MNSCLVAEFAKLFEGQSTGIPRLFWDHLSLLWTFCQIWKPKIARMGLHLGNFKKKRLSQFRLDYFETEPVDVGWNTRRSRSRRGWRNCSRWWSSQMVVQMVSRMAWALQRLLEMFWKLFSKRPWDQMKC